MNKYKLTCLYCDNIWEMNYIPESKIYCDRCRDTNIKIKDNRVDKVDYYIGCPEFLEDKDWGF